MSTSHTVDIEIFDDPDAAPTIRIADIPWYAGLTALQAMIVGEAMHPKNFSFRVEYRSIYGAQIDAIDGLEDKQKPNHFWLLFVDNAEAPVGASECILPQDDKKSKTLVQWKYSDIGALTSPTLDLKTRAL